MADKEKTPSALETKRKAADMAAAALEKQFGKGTLIRLGDKLGIKHPCIPTGIYGLDKQVIEAGGIPRGRITEIYGPESGGKTTLVLMVIAAAQANGELCAFIDAEHALDVNYAAALGVNLKELWFNQPDNGEQALEIAEALIVSGAFAVVAIDSVAALVPKAELEGDMGDSVIYDTPIYLRRKGSNVIDIVQIGDLHRKNATGWYKKTNAFEVLTHEGWQPLKGVQKKKNATKKPIVYTRTSTGYVATTYDHSLFVNGKEASPSELKVFDRVDIFPTPPQTGTHDLLVPDIAWLLGFYVAEGSTPRTKLCNRFSVCNTKKRLIDKCSAIVDKHFNTSYSTRTTVPTETRSALHVLDCQTDSTLGFYMQECIAEQSLSKKIPAFVLNGNDLVKKAFLEGFWEGDGSSSDKKNPLRPKKYHNNSWVVMAGIQYLNSSLGIRTNVTIHTGRPEQITLSENKGKQLRKENEILQFYEGAAPEFLYDIETAAGTFVVAIGGIICHNSHMGLQARLMSQACRKLTGAVTRSGTALIFINQIREKIGVMFGSPETTTGGRALKFYASLRLDVRRIAGKKEGDEVVGNKVKIKAAKNKVGAPFKEVIVDLNFGKGFDAVGDLVDIAVTREVIEKSGSWYSFKGERLNQGRDGAIEFLKDNKDTYKKIYAAVEASEEVEEVAERVV